MYILSQITLINYPLVAVRITQQQHQRGGVDNVNPSPLYYHCPVKLVVKLNNVCAREQYTAPLKLRKTNCRALTKFHCRSPKPSYSLRSNCPNIV